METLNCLKASQKIGDSGKKNETWPNLTYFLIIQIYCSLHGKVIFLKGIFLFFSFILISLLISFSIFFPPCHTYFSFLKRKWQREKNRRRSERRGGWMEEGGGGKLNEKFNAVKEMNSKHFYFYQWAEKQGVSLFLFFFVLKNVLFSPFFPYFLSFFFS